ncbi:MAG: hypothetical protein AAGN82_17875 [Myxococcota bacterium]
MITRMTPFGSAVWTVDRPLRFMGLEVGTRMTIVQTDGGGLWIASPVALDDAMREALARLGAIRFVVAPNRFHHLYVGDYARTEAELLGPPGLLEKRRDVDWTRSIDTRAVWSGGDIVATRVGGMPVLDELVFFHRPSRTLIATDLLMNWAPQGRWLTDAALWLEGVTGTPGVPRLFRFFGVRDRAALRDSLEEILAWNFDRLIVTHGDNVAKGAKDLVARAFGRL